MNIPNPFLKIGDTFEYDLIPGFWYLITSYEIVELVQVTCIILGDPEMYGEICHVMLHIGQLEPKRDTLRKL